MILTPSAARDATVPARPRLVSRTRRMAFGGLLLLTTCVTICTSLAAHTATPTTGSAHVLLPPGAGLLAGSVAGWVLARRSTRAMEQLFEQEDRMLRAAVHELTRPLSRLVATLGGNQDRDPPDAVLRNAQVHARTLHRLVDDLSEVARVMTGSAPLVREPVRLDRLVATLPDADELGHAHMKLDTAPVEVAGSPRLLRLAVTNLVRNAAQHAYRNGPGAITVRVNAAGVAVLDTGPGMTEEHLTQLTRDVWVGLPDGRAGLGLNLVSWVTQVHGGRLRFTNQLEGGLQVLMELPVNPSPERPARPGVTVADGA